MIEILKESSVDLLRYNIKIIKKGYIDGNNGIFNANRIKIYSSTFYRYLLDYLVE